MIFSILSRIFRRNHRDISIVCRACGQPFVWVVSDDPKDGADYLPPGASPPALCLGCFRQAQHQPQPPARDWRGQRSLPW
jgi:hypothetical protein